MQFLNILFIELTLDKFKFDKSTDCNEVQFSNIEYAEVAFERLEFDKLTDLSELNENISGKYYNDGA